MIKIIMVLGILLTSVYSTTGSCWDIRDKGLLADAELDGNIIFSFKDAKTCKAIVGVDISFFNNSYTTDSKGHINISIPSENIDKNIPLIAKKENYITLEQNVKAQVGSFWQNKFLLTKTMPIKSARFILAWKENPKDLDLHLASDDFHISYRNKNNSFSKARLDRDSTRGYGPETITLDFLDKSKTYKIFIHKYSSSGKLDHNVNLALYKNNKIDKTISLSDNLTSDCVQVATIEDNKIKYNIKDVEHKKGTCK